MPSTSDGGSPASRIVLVGATSFVLSVGSCFLMARIHKVHNVPTVLAVIFLFMFSVLLPYVVVAQSLYYAFRATRSPLMQARLIIVTYFVLIAVFTGFYFSMQFMGDYNFAIGQYLYYRFAGEDLRRGRTETVNAYPHDPHAIIGVTDHLWSTLDDQISLDDYRGLQNFEEHKANLAVENSFYDVVTFRQRSIWPVVGDCFHLSVMTMTSVGYGNIAPRVWYAKLATDAEALTGVVLFVVALGMLFARLNGGEQ
jgi:hypothetical protein